MRKVLTIFILTITAQFAVGQTKGLTTDSDTVYWYKFYNSLISKIGIQPVSKSDSEFIFRFWDGVKVVDINYNQNQPQGTVVFFLRQYKKKKEGRLYFRRQALSSETASKLYDVIVNYNLRNIPTDNQIKGWVQGFDGIEYITEQSDKNSFSFKTYWTPAAQSGVKEAGQILDFITELDSIVELKTMHDNFMDGQPFTSWYGGIQQGTIVRK